MFGFVSSLLNLRTGTKVDDAPPSGRPEGRPAGAEPEGGRRKRRKGGYTEFTSYYGRPVVKKAHWVWPIWLYFWTGGIVAGSSAIAALTELVGDKERDYSIIRAARYISLAGALVSPVLLIVDLQRPERFHHMLRVLKLRSPLSVGTYILTSTGVLTGLNTARQVVEDGFFPADNLLGQLALSASSPVTRMLQGVDGLALGGYTGVLLSATATPLWADMNELIAPTFISSSFATGAAAISLARAVAGAPVEELHRLDPIEQMATLSEMSLLAAAIWRLKPQVRKHLLEGQYGQAFAGAVGFGMVGPLLLQLLSPKHGPLARPLNIITAIMALFGGFLLRYSLIEAGKASAEDADAYHAITRGEGRATPQEQAAKGRQAPRVQPPEYGPLNPDFKN